MDHIQRIGEAMLPQILGAGFATLAARTAHGDDGGIFIQAARLQRSFYLLDKLRIALHLETLVFAVPVLAVGQHERNVCIHHVGIADKHDF